MWKAQTANFMIAKEFILQSLFKEKMVLCDQIGTRKVKYTAGWDKINLEQYKEESHFGGSYQIAIQETPNGSSLRNMLQVLWDSSVFHTLNCKGEGH